MSYTRCNLWPSEDIHTQVPEIPLRKRAARILVVEDNDDNRLLMRDLLDSRGYEVITAESADAAERAIHRQAPDLILSMW
jgi:response regulator RpfG family c-di-GMP phosphodiesterase